MTKTISSKSKIGTRLKAAAILAPLAISACANIDTSHAVTPINGPASTIVSTDYSSALSCVASFAENQSYPAPRIAVGHITDLTGANDYFNGRRITQGATLMAMTAVADAGMRLVERYDMGVIQVDLDYAKSGLVRDSKTKVRDVKAGQLEGADLYIVGGITEFNPNIQSGGFDFFLGGSGTDSGALAIGNNYYIIDVGMDLRLVDARSSEVLSVRSFRKQIVGYEREGGAFDLVGSVLVDAAAGKKALEPVQSSVRGMVDRAVFEFSAGLYGLDPANCFDPSSVRWKDGMSAKNRGGDRFYNYHKSKNIRNVPSTAMMKSANFEQQAFIAPKPQKQQAVVRSQSIAPTATISQPEVYSDDGQFFVEIAGFSSQAEAQSAWNSGSYQKPNLIGSLGNEIVPNVDPRTGYASGFSIVSSTTSLTNAERICATYGSRTCSILGPIEPVVAPTLHSDQFLRSRF